MQRKTSTAISIKFTLYVLALLGMLGICINTLFFMQRYSGESQKLLIPMNQTFKQRRFIGPDVLIFPSTPQFIQELKQHTVSRNIARIDDEYLLYTHDMLTVRVIVVSHFIDAQKKLALTSIFTLCIFGIITYLLSRHFVKSSLRRIDGLVEYVQHLNMDKLDKPVPLDGPSEDEIRIIAEKLQQALNRIKQQTDSLKDFVSYASHELKTPLMSINAMIDLAEKTDTYRAIGPDIKKTINTINKLFETLLLITRREFDEIKNQDTDINPIIQRSIHTFSQQYEHKHIQVERFFPEKHIVSTNPEVFQIIINNLLSNAFKFTPQKGNITIHLEEKILRISNTGPGIPPEHRDAIRDRFYKHHQSDQEDGFGLGLYMINMLVRKHGRTIAVDSIPHKTTTFTISMI